MFPPSGETVPSSRGNMISRPSGEHPPYTILSSWDRVYYTLTGNMISP